MPWREWRMAVGRQVLHRAGAPGAMRWNGQRLGVPEGGGGRDRALLGSMLTAWWGAGRLWGEGAGEGLCRPGVEAGAGGRIVAGEGVESLRAVMRRARFRGRALPVGWGRREVVRAGGAGAEACLRGAVEGVGAGGAKTKLSREVAGAA